MDSWPFRPEYVTFCRGLRLEREFGEGDYYTAPVPVSVIAPGGFEVLVWVALYRLPMATERCVWLPRSDQWDAMLERLGYLEVHMAGRPVDVTYEYQAKVLDAGFTNPPRCQVWSGGGVRAARR